MDISKEDLRNRYDSLVDAKLIELWKSDLTELARNILKEELEKRQIPTAFEKQRQELRDDFGSFITLTSMSNFVEANILCSLLESENISAVILDSHLATANSFLSSAAGGIRIQVQELQYNDARAILARYDAGDYEESE